jgi:putative ABC transport system permease protein
MSTLIQDLKYGLRMLGRNPGFAAIAALTLALGVAANTTIFSFVDAVIIRPLPYPNPGELVGLGQWRMLNGKYVQAGVSAPNFRDIEKQNDVFQQVGYYLFHSYNLTSGNPPEHLTGATVSSSMLTLLGVQPALGRNFTAQELQPGRDKEVILGYQLWQRQFGGNRDVIGRTLQLDDAPYTIVGVMPRNFYFIWDDQLDVITPLALPASRWTEAGRSSRDLQTMARLKPGAPHIRAQKEMDTIAARLAAAHPRSDGGWGIRVEPLHAAYHRHIALPLMVIASAAFLVLLIACVNVANLLLVHSTARRKEIAVRLAMGARRSRLVAQMLTESVLLGLAGGVIGILFSYAGVRALALGCERYFPLSGTQWISLNGTVLVFCLVLALITGFVFGLAPVFQASRIDLNEHLKESGSSVTSEAGRCRLRNGLVISEVCFAVILLVGAGLLLRTFVNVLNVDVGFDSHNVLEAMLSLPNYKYKTPSQQAEFFHSAIDGLQALPGVQAAGGFLPSDELLFTPEGAAPASPAEEPNAMLWIVSPGFFQTVRAALLSGREFTAADDQAGAPVAIINRTLAHRYFPNLNPVGHSLVPQTQVYSEQPGGTPRPLRIVGIVKDIKMGGSTVENAQVFVPYMQHPVGTLLFAVRTAAQPLSAVPAVRGVVTSLDNELPLVRVTTLESQLERYYGAVRFPYVIVWIFALLALVLSAIGIYGVIAYSVSRRTREIGIRMALGAECSDVLRLVLGQGLRLAMIGIVIGIAGAVALTRFLASMLYGVKPADPLTFVAVVLVLIAVALAACYIPARRAAKVDPMVALRYE